jgi:hypothetical protein
MKRPKQNAVAKVVDQLPQRRTILGSSMIPTARDVRIALYAMGHAACWPRRFGRQCRHGGEDRASSIKDAGADSAFHVAHPPDLMGACVSSRAQSRG